ncbi:hypothetical protein Ctha_0678 [Chloroherpeton thalassium ATCC 35110]|uniref:Uncharacterized protein n=1 Tax=Chloroherpeton thalassium (strain ATCC 35110 / GB-78) TaxID=517418 RepID=B3QVU0_CHLT3|nr:hypothetical protein [Chloroherpeton thalassium]ACF13147.1 hypothetical protein Ctha_0678 [Chloroherpeton thalassium ATCC 35110]
MNTELQPILKRVTSISKIFSRLDSQSCNTLVFSDYYGDVAGRLSLQNGYVLIDHKTDVQNCINKYLLGLYALNVLDSEEIQVDGFHEKRELKDFICATLKDVDFLIQQAFLANINQLWLGHGMNNLSSLDVKSRTREDLYLFIFFFNSPRPMCDFGEKFPKINRDALICSVIRLTILGYLSVSTGNHAALSESAVSARANYLQESQIKQQRAHFEHADQKRTFLEKLLKKIRDI